LSSTFCSKLFDGTFTTGVAFGQATVGKPFPASRLAAVIPVTIGMAKLLEIAVSAGKQTFLVETAASPDFLVKVLQHEPTFLQLA